MKNTQLKRIVERHYFTGTPLTYDEYDALKDTEYANVITKPSRFKGIIEAMDNPPPKRNKRPAQFNGGIDKRTVKGLIDDIEDRFDLEIFNVDASKYKRVDVDELRSFISTWSERNIMEQATTDYVNRALEEENVYLILAKLCWACT